MKRTWWAVGVVALAAASAGSRAAGGDAAAAKAEDVKIETTRGVALAGTLHLPAKPNGVAVVIASGQGYHRALPLLKRSAEALAAAGFTALTFDWAYFTAKGKASEDLSVEGQDLDAALAFVRARPGVAKVLLAGKSLGSIVALRRAAAKPAEIVGLALLTFPLHEPDDPSKALRDGPERLLDLSVPTVVINGGNDPLCRLDTLYSFLAKAKSPPRVVVVPGDHSFNRAEGDKSETDDNVGLATSALVLWARRMGGL